MDTVGSSMEATAAVPRGLFPKTFPCHIVLRNLLLLCKPEAECLILFDTLDKSIFSLIPCNDCVNSVFLGPAVYSFRVAAGRWNRARSQKSEVSEKCESVGQFSQLHLHNFYGFMLRVNAKRWNVTLSQLHFNQGAMLTISGHAPYFNDDMLT